MRQGETVDLRELFSEAQSGTGTARTTLHELGLARIVRAATALQARRETLSAMPCHLFSRCRGFLRLRLQDLPPMITWRCSKCRTRGSILNWPRTPWDLTPAADREGSDARSLYEIALEPTHYFSLLELAIGEAAFLRIVFSAIPRDSSILLAGNLSDFLYLLERCIERSSHPDVLEESDTLNQICQCLEAKIRDLERLDEEHPDADSLAIMELPGWLPPDLAERLRGALQDGHFRSIDELNDQLAQTMDAYNRSPSSELAGLSPRQVSDLLDSSWDGHGVLHLNEALEPRKLDASPYFRSASFLLRMAKAEGGIPTTATGNLNRRVVSQMLEECRLSFPTHRFKVINEVDVRQIHISRVLCELGGLLRRQRRKFLVTRRGSRMASPERASELFRHLFAVFFRKLNLAYIDQGSENHALQQTVAFSFYALQQLGDEWQTDQTLAHRILIPAAFQDALDSGDQQPGCQVHGRLLLPLNDFGLLEHRQVELEGSLVDGCEFRLAPLFREFIQFSF